MLDFVHISLWLVNQEPSRVLALILDSLYMAKGMLMRKVDGIHREK